MKILMSLLAIVLLTKECDQKKGLTASNTDSIEEVSRSLNQTQERMVITYEASTRGFYEKIWIDKDSTSFSNDRNLKIVTSQLTTKRTWDELTEIIKNTEVKSLPNLEAPSKMFQYDGAAMSTLKIDLGETFFKTNIFDHGNPPKEIETLVNKVLSIKEMMVKQ